MGDGVVALFFGGPLDGHMRSLPDKAPTVNFSYLAPQQPESPTDAPYQLTSGGEDETAIYEHIELSSPLLDVAPQIGSESWVEKQLRKMIDLD